MRVGIITTLTYLMAAQEMSTHYCHYHPGRTHVHNWGHTHHTGHDTEDKIKSLMNALQATTEKLEKHELREMQVGDQQSKTLEVIVSRVQSQDSAINAINAGMAKIEEKLTKIQGKLEQKSEDEKRSCDIDTARLQSWMSDVEKKLNYNQDQVKLETKELKVMFNNSINEISNNIIENQNGGLFNLSHKIDSEIEGLWQIIGATYESQVKLEEAMSMKQLQTVQFSNESLSKKDCMDERILEILRNISGVKENVNSLMDTLLLVTQEVNQTKDDLVTAFKNLTNVIEPTLKFFEPVLVGTESPEDI